MLHPSYTELMNAVNSEVKEGEQPIVSSRYSIVIAAAKRARQIIAGAESAVPDYKNKKPLSVAVDELMNGDVKILSSGEDADDEDDKPSISMMFMTLLLMWMMRISLKMRRKILMRMRKMTKMLMNSEAKEDMSSEEDDYE